MDYPIMIVPLSDEDGGGFMSYAPDLPGCMSDGETQEEALINLRGAMLEWLDLFASRHNGVSPPAPGSSAVAVQEERRRLVDLLTQATAKIDDRIDQLARDINDIRERIEAIEEWSRFGRLVPAALLEGDERVVLLISH